MVITNRDILYAVGLSAIFLAGFFGFTFLYSFLLAPIRRRRRLRQRVDKIQKEIQLRAQVFKASPIKDSVIIRLLEKVGARRKIEGLQIQLQQADIYLDVAVFLGIAVLLAFVGFFLGNLHQGFLGGALAAVVLGAMPFLVLRQMKRRKGLLVERQMPEVMELLARSLRAGHTLSAAIELASKETPHPLGTELRMAYEEQRLGIGVTEALEHMVKRVDSRDLRYFVTAVLIQSETGGSLAEVMEKIGHLIRERLKVKGKIKTLTAEGRLSALILGALPFLMFLVLYLVRHDYIMTLFEDPLGQKMMVAGMISILIGVISMKKLIQIDL